VRMDLLKAQRPSRWMPGRSPSSARVIATCRRPVDGGAYRGSERSRTRLLAEAAEAGADFVDVEWGSAAARNLEIFAPAKVILSRHDRFKTPALESLRRIEETLSSRPGIAACKIVTLARRPADILRIRDLLGGTPDRTVPLIAFCMGEIGAASRILAPSWGSWATYVRRDGGRETAPGQLTLGDAVGVYRIGGIDAATEIVGIAGWPVSHSLSPVLHNAAFAHDHLGFRYLPFPARRAGDLAGLMQALPIRGLSVTAPHKVAVMKLLADLEPLARAIGAVNTVLGSPD